MATDSTAGSPRGEEAGGGVEEAGDGAARRRRVVVVDDHAIWRDGVRGLLEGTEFAVVGEAGSGAESLRVVRETDPDLVLMDIRMADGDGLDALRALKEERPGVAVLMLTTFDNPIYMARAVAGGASGYLLKGIDRDELLGALRAVARGEMLLSARDLARALRGLGPDAGETAGPQAELVEPLTDREKEVLRLLSAGLNNREMAGLLFIAESTVKTHVEHIIGKLGVSDRVQAAVWAARRGFSEGPAPGT